MNNSREIPAAFTSRFYPAVWRWHFYAGIAVIPFLLLLSLSGLLMLISKPVEPLLYRHVTTVTPQAEAQPASVLLASVRHAYPHAQVQLYIPASNATAAAQFLLTAGGHADHVGHNAATTSVYVNPYSGAILGELDPSKTLYTRLKTFHGSLYLGNVGDSLIEIAAGIVALMLVSGLYLAWPRASQAPLLVAAAQRRKWRRVHRSLGFVVALPLMVFLLSGLAWTNVWGGKLVQAWGSLPGTRLASATAVTSHETLNRYGLHQVPWAIEQTPMPSSAQQSPNFGLNDVVNFARENGFDRFRVHLPKGDDGVWTVSASTIAGDVKNPQRERTVHLAPHDGKVLAALQFSDYPALGKAMATFVPLHQGDLGLWNWLLNLVLALLIIVMALTGIALWWCRRPLSGLRLAPPPADSQPMRVVVLAMLAVSLLFPLSMAILLVTVLLDSLLLSRLTHWRALVKS